MPTILVGGQSAYVSFGLVVSVWEWLLVSQKGMALQFSDWWICFVSRGICDMALLELWANDDACVHLSHYLSVQASTYAKKHV